MSNFGYAGAAAGANDALVADLIRRHAEMMQQEQLKLQQAASQRQADELALRHTEYDDTRKNRKAQVALDALSPGVISDEQAAPIKGTDYEPRLSTITGLSRRGMSGDLASGTMAPNSDAGGQAMTVLQPTAAQQKAQAQEQKTNVLEGLIKRGAPRNELAGAFVGAGENVPPSLIGEDPAAKDAREHGYRMGEIDAQGRNSARVAGIGAASRENAGDNALVRVEHKDPTTGRTVIEYLPKSQVRGQTFEKGAGATAESRLASAQAVNQTGEDIIAKLSTPAYAAAVGPAMGRFSSVREFIGNPPPEYADLAGQIESYALANMGVHGMRSAQGAEAIAHLLDQKHTPQSLIATIRGLNSFSQHFMENEGRATGAQKPAAGGDAEYDWVDGKLVPRGK